MASQNKQSAAVQRCVAWIRAANGGIRQAKLEDAVLLEAENASKYLQHADELFDRLDKASEDLVRLGQERRTYEAAVDARMERIRGFCESLLGKEVRGHGATNRYARRVHRALGEILAATDGGDPDEV